MATARDRYGAARKKKKKSSLFAPLSFLLVCVAIIFGMGVFFRVQTIEVRGTESYTEQQIIDSSGISVGDNLFFLNSSAASSRIYSNLPLVENASVKQELPNKVIITIKESSAMAYVVWEGQNWMMTGSCKLLGSVAPEELGGLTRVINIGVTDPTAGDPMTVPEEDSLKLTYLQDLLSAMEELGIGKDVSEIDMANAANPTFRYLDRFTVRMGNNNNTDYKLRMLMSAVMQLDADMSGTMDLSSGGTSVSFSPD